MKDWISEMIASLVVMVVLGNDTLRKKNEELWTDIGRKASRQLRETLGTGTGERIESAVQTLLDESLVAFHRGADEDDNLEEAA